MVKPSKTVFFTIINLLIFLLIYVYSATIPASAKSGRMHGISAISLAHLSLLARYLTDPLCEPNRPNRTTRKIVIIVTFMRSGSTFLGELFNVHDDVFYMFEPLHPWSSSGCAQSTLGDRMKVAVF